MLVAWALAELACWSMNLRCCWSMNSRSLALCVVIKSLGECSPAANGRIRLMGRSAWRGGWPERPGGCMRCVGRVVQVVHGALVAGRSEVAVADARAWPQSANGAASLGSGRCVWLCCESVTEESGMDDVRTDGALRFFVCNHDSAVCPCPHPCERDVQVAVGEGTAVLRSARRREVYND